MSQKTYHVAVYHQHVDLNRCATSEGHLRTEDRRGRHSSMPLMITNPYPDLSSAVRPNPRCLNGPFDTVPRAPYAHSNFDFEFRSIRSLGPVGRHRPGFYALSVVTLPLGRVFAPVNLVALLYLPSSSGRAVPFPLPFPAAQISWVPYVFGECSNRPSDTLFPFTARILLRLYGPIIGAHPCQRSICACTYQTYSIFSGRLN